MDGDRSAGSIKSQLGIWCLQRCCGWFRRRRARRQQPRSICSHFTSSLQAVSGHKSGTAPRKKRRAARQCFLFSFSARKWHFWWLLCSQRVLEERPVRRSSVYSLCRGNNSKPPGSTMGAGSEVERLHRTWTWAWTAFPHWFEWT